MSCRTIAGTAAGGVSYHYENVDAASSVTFVLTLPKYRRRRHGRRELLLCYRECCFERLALYRTIAGAAAMRLRAACHFCPSVAAVATNADWRGVRYGAVAGTAVGGVSYFYAIVAAALSGMSC